MFSDISLRRKPQPLAWAQRWQEPLCPLNLKLYSGVRPQSKVWCAVVAGVRPQSKVAGDCTLAPDPGVAPRPEGCGKTRGLRQDPGAAAELGAAPRPGAAAELGAAGSTRDEGLFAGKLAKFCFLAVI